jgi:hypothetical protein
MDILDNLDLGIACSSPTEGILAMSAAFGKANQALPPPAPCERLIVRVFGGPQQPTDDIDWS